MNQCRTFQLFQTNNEMNGEILTTWVFYQQNNTQHMVLIGQSTQTTMPYVMFETLSPYPPCIININHEMQRLYGSNNVVYSKHV